MKKTLNKYGKENSNEIPKALVSALGSSLFLNIQDNALKGQIQSYLSSPESILKIPSLDVSSFKKNANINEKNDILTKYVNTEENRIDEHSCDKEIDLESGGLKIFHKTEDNTDNIPNESPKFKKSNDEVRKQAIYNNMMKKDEDKDSFNIKISKI